MHHKSPTHQPVELTADVFTSTFRGKKTSQVTGVGSRPVEWSMLNFASCVVRPPRMLYLYNTCTTVIARNWFGICA